MFIGLVIEILNGEIPHFLMKTWEIFPDWAKNRSDEVVLKVVRPFYRLQERPQGVVVSIRGLKVTLAWQNIQFSIIPEQLKVRNDNQNRLKETRGFS